MTVKLGLVKLLQKEFDLCEEAYVFATLNASEIPAELFSRRNTDVDVQCPVQEGRYVVKQTVALPKEIPKGELPIVLQCSVSF